MQKSLANHWTQFLKQLSITALLYSVHIILLIGEVQQLLHTAALRTPLCSLIMNFAVGS